jgi:hypothetical protein
VGDLQKTLKMQANTKEFQLEEIYADTQLGDAGNNR